MINTDQKNGVYFIRLNRPEARNALNRSMREALAKALRSIPSEARVVALMGAPSGFCSGQDLSEFDKDSDVAQIMEEEYLPVLEAIDALEIPLIAGVQGACAGAGVSLALAADLVLASKDAFFQIAFGRIGLVPDILISYQLPRIIGHARAMGMALTGERVSAEDAQNWGMIWQSFESDEFQDQFNAFCAEMAQGASLALGKTRKLMRESWAHLPKEQFALETRYQSEAAKSEDFAEGVRAFLEKRAPNFKGR